MNKISTLFALFLFSFGIFLLFGTQKSFSFTTIDNECEENHYTQYTSLFDGVCYKDVGDGITAFSGTDSYEVAFCKQGSYPTWTDEPCSPSYPETTACIPGGYHHSSIDDEAETPNQCIWETKTKTIPNGEATCTWNVSDWNCGISSCDPNHHKSTDDNEYTGTTLQCLPDTKNPPFDNGTKTCSWNDITKNWNCSISCDPGYIEDGGACIEIPTTCSITKKINTPDMNFGEFHHVLYGVGLSPIANSNGEISSTNKGLLIDALDIEKGASWQTYTTTNDDDGNNNNPSSLIDLDDEGTMYEINTTNPRYSLIKILDMHENIVGYNVYENTCTTPIDPADPLEVLIDNITGICLNPDDYWEASDYPLPEGNCVPKTADLSVQADITSPYEVNIGAGEFYLPLKVHNHGVIYKSALKYIDNVYLF